LSPPKFEIKNPLVIMYQEPDGSVVTRVHPGNHTYEHYGMLVCDLTRHIARAFQVDEEAVWEWVDKERHRPTTNIRQPS
jgi:hypothetical protein